MALDKLQAVLDTFAMFDTADRTNLLLDYAKLFKDVPPSVATRPFDKSCLVPHCESEAYVWAIRQTDGTLKLHFAVENPAGISAKALATILDKSLSGLPPAEIATDHARHRRADLPAEHLDGQRDGADVDGAGGAIAGEGGLPSGALAEAASRPSPSPVSVPRHS